jgi:hypothetical protein
LAGVGQIDRLASVVIPYRRTVKERQDPRPPAFNLCVIDRIKP